VRHQRPGRQHLVDDLRLPVEHVLRGQQHAAGRAPQPQPALAHQQRQLGQRAGVAVQKAYALAVDEGHHLLQVRLHVDHRQADDRVLGKAAHRLFLKAAQLHPHVAGAEPRAHPLVKDGGLLHGVAVAVHREPERGSAGAAGGHGDGAAHGHLQVPRGRELGALHHGDPRREVVRRADVARMHAVLVVQAAVEPAARVGMVQRLPQAGELHLHQAVRRQVLGLLQQPVERPERRGLPPRVRPQRTDAPEHLLAPAAAAHRARQRRLHAAAPRAGIPPIASPR
jgi:hypothetical protein